jgi:dienelactone hydrolase
MNVKENLKPALWGMFGGGIAAIVLGFTWGGWITAGAAGQMETASAKAAVVGELAPLCVATAEQQHDKMVVLKEQSSWKYTDFVVKAGWVDNVSKNYRDDVASACASTLIESMEAS